LTYLSRHQTADGPRWARDGHFLPSAFELGFLLDLPQASLETFLSSLPVSPPAEGALLPPVEASHEVWAAGVTYLRSREAREAESSLKDVYTRVYEAARPELFFKAVGFRVVGHGMSIRVRKDSAWNVPEPELVVVINSRREIVGYTVGNDVSSRDIEGENPLYLPQAKVYRGSCALGPGIVLSDVASLAELGIQLSIIRAGKSLFEGETRIARMKRSFSDLVEYLTAELDFPRGVLLSTGTGIVPPADFSLQAGDKVSIRIGALTLENEVATT
jgi:2-dehydro-3-deoxy-D-arabinonate dehydratase